MDGLKKRLNASAQYRLSFSLSVAIVAIALAASIFSFASSFHRAQELQDDVLFQIAALVAQSGHAWTLPEGGIELEDSDHDSWVYIQNLKDAAPGPSDSILNPRIPKLHSTLTDGMHTVDLANGAYRVFVESINQHTKIAISQQTRIRDKVAYRSALDTLLPFIILVPILLIIIARIIRNIFTPITILSRQIDTRSENDLRPMRDANIPSEVKPFVHAINRLLVRVDESIKIQQRFIADAAHELRSPLTALSLQAERLDTSEMPDAAREQLQILRKGIQRGRNLLNQLLSLSRIQAAGKRPVEAISVYETYRSVVEDLMPLAKSKHIDLGVLEGPDVIIQGNKLDLYTMIKNLADNAIRYTPVGGRVDLSAVSDQRNTIIRVVDTGPGIPQNERERVFDAFHRILGTEQLGSGLGLAIVKTVAERFGARIALDFTDPTAQVGLTVTIEIPHPTRSPQ